MFHWYLFKGVGFSGITQNVTNKVASGNLKIILNWAT